MKDILKICIILMVVCLVSGLCLGLVYNVAKPRITETSAQLLLNSLEVVLPQATRFSDELSRELPDGRTIRYYEGYSTSGETVGYALLGEKQGYQSELRVLVGIDPQGLIKGIKVLQQAETPGLGARVDEVEVNETLWARIAQLLKGERGEEISPRPWFQEQYNGLTLGELKVIKPPYKGKGIHALTGATITSVALTEAVRDSIELFLKTEKGGESG